MGCLGDPANPNIYCLTYSVTLIFSYFIFSLSFQQLLMVQGVRMSEVRLRDSSMAMSWVQLRLQVGLETSDVKLIIIKLFDEILKIIAIKFIRYVNNIQFLQMAKREADRRSEETSALIATEWQLVVSGKHPQKLVQIIQDYELDLLTNPIDKNPTLMEKYVWALLIAGEYLQLKFLMKRTKEVQNKKIILEIAEAGAAQNLKALSKYFREYLGVLEDERVREKLREGTLKAILNILSKHFINYKIQQLQKWVNCSEQELKELGYSIDGGFVQLKNEEVVSECLMDKLKELAVVANRMSKFE